MVWKYWGQFCQRRFKLQINSANLNTKHVIKASSICAARVKNLERSCRLHVFTPLFYARVEPQLMISRARQFSSQFDGIWINRWLPARRAQMAELILSRLSHMQRRSQALKRRRAAAREVYARRSLFISDMGPGLETRRLDEHLFYPPVDPSLRTHRRRLQNSWAIHRKDDVQTAEPLLELRALLFGSILRSSLLTLCSGGVDGGTAYPPMHIRTRNLLQTEN